MESDFVLPCNTISYVKMFFFFFFFFKKKKEILLCLGKQIHGLSNSVKKSNATNSKSSFDEDVICSYSEKENKKGNFSIAHK